MPALDDIAVQKLRVLEAKQQKRILTETRCDDGIYVVRGGKRLLSFSTNDYYGMSRHPVVIAAAEVALKHHGAGAGASRMVSGNHPLYARLEAKLAEIKQAEAALVFGSGYLANTGVIPALVSRGDLILADKLSHASMIDGAKLSGAAFYRFAHNNVEHCRELLTAHRDAHPNCLIMTETIFSMDGDRAPLAELMQLAKEFDAWVLADDAHGLGMCEENIKPHILIGTLSKACGSYGGYAAGNKVVMEYLSNAARSFVYSTGLPPASIAAAEAALELLQKDAELAARPLKLARMFTSRLELPLAQSAIVPVVLGDTARAMAAAALLAEHGYYVAAIRPPTVPSARLRFTFSALHDEADIEKLTSLIKTHGYAERQLEAV